MEQAFDYVALLTHTYWKPISATTIFVTQDTANKRRDYEDFVVKTFYITNASTTQEFQEISTAVRTITNITRVFTVNPQKALVVRGSADAVALAEKLVHDLDKPKSEVVVDVLIMEANTSRTRDLAATLASGGTAGLNHSDYLHAAGGCDHASDAAQPPQPPPATSLWRNSATCPQPTFRPRCRARCCKPSSATTRPKS